jgi:hypothetical protein
MKPERWTFFRAGGFDQVKLDSGRDLVRIDELDQKLWVALACPTSGLELDPRTLALIDTDKDGRVRATELIAAVKFAGANLKDPDDLLKAEAILPLSRINDAQPEGKTLLSAARQILANIGKADATAIGVDDVSDPTRVFADSAFNGDGVITEISTSDEATKTVIREIMEQVGSDLDRCGKPGVTQEKIDLFFAEAEAHVAWYSQAETDSAQIFPLGPEATTAAVAAIQAVKTKVDDYFARCRLVAYDPRAVTALNHREEEYFEIAAKDLSATLEEVADFPLAQVAAERPLPLSGPVNPAHAAALETLRDAAVRPILGPRGQLTEADWAAMGAKIAAHQAWMGAQLGQRVRALGLVRIREILASGAQARLVDLVARDKALEAEAASIENVERLVRYHQDLALLCTNFVNFKHFYSGHEASVFQCGTLYLDQRSCLLCLRVEDADKHAIMAGLAGVYLAYLDCTRKGSIEKMGIVAAFTAGDTDNLMVGRNGVFYDRRGQDWDATITKIIDNPISVRQAFWSPYKKFVRFLEEQVAKRAAASEAKSHGALSATAATTAHVGAATPPPEAKKIDVGTVAALGVAVGAIGTFVTALIGYGAGVFKLGPLAFVGAIIGVMLLISLPSVVLAYVKLRKRNLGPILDANRWAVNAKAKINVPFGATLTGVAKLPPGSRRDARDPYSEKGPPWKRVVLLLVLAGLAYEWYQGAFDRVLPERARPSSIFERLEPPAPAGK